MAVEDIRLQNFRSYQDESFEFEPGVNIIVGPNAAGKTSLLEAVQIICLGGSYRAGDADLVQKEQDWARLDAHTGFGPRAVKFELLGPGRIRKTFSFGGKTLKRLAYDKTIPVVMFEPNHLQLLTGPKELRRNFLDGLLEQTVNSFSLLRRQYKRALTQRNTLLKKGPGQAAQLFAWNVRLGELGGKIATERIHLVEVLNQELQNLYRELSTTKSSVTVRYETACDARDYGSQLLKKLEASREIDYQRGFTAYGPHRDDFAIGLNGYPAANVASRGEVRTLLLGLKLIELKLIENVRSKKPILLLDDVFGELDGARRRALTEFLRGHQAFITTTDADIVVQHFMDKAHIIPVNKP